MAKNNIGERRSDMLDDRREQERKEYIRTRGGGGAYTAKDELIDLSIEDEKERKTYVKKKAQYYKPTKKKCREETLAKLAERWLNL